MRFPRWADHMRRLHARRYETVRAAYDAGIPIYTGTDAGGGLAHGLVGQEVAELVKAGIPARDALSAATWGRGPGSDGRGSPRGPPPISSSTTRIRAPMCGC